MIAHSIHIVIRLDACTYHTPCFHRTSGVRKNHFIFLLTIHYSFTKLRKKHYAVRFRSTRIFYFRFEKRHGIYIISRLRFKNIQMKMRSEWIAGIPTPCYLLSRFYWILIRFGDNLYFPVFIFILQFFHPFGNRGNKTAQMTIDSRITVMIADIKYIARTIRHTDTWNIAFCQCTNRFTDYSSRFKIQSAVKVIRTDFSEVSAQCKRKVKRWYKGGLLLFLPISSDAASQHQSGDISSHHSIHFLLPQMYTIPTKLRNIRKEW